MSRSSSNFKYENSDKHGLKVSRIDSEDLDPINKMVERGARLETPKQIVHGDTRVQVNGKEVIIETDEKIRGKANPDGSLDWFGDARIHGDIQSKGSRAEIWQKVVSTGDNLIELNTGIDGSSLKAPYSGIEINRGKDVSAFLVFPEDTKRWTTVMEEERRKLAIHGDRLSKFQQDLTTDDVPEGKKNKYARPITSSQNFWVSDEVKPTRGNTREILPAFIPIHEGEEKKIINCRGKVSRGTVEIQAIADGTPVSDPLEVKASKISKQNLNHALEDGSSVGIEILSSSNGRNLSVSISILTHFC